MYESVLEEEDADHAIAFACMNRARGKLGEPFLGPQVAKMCRPCNGRLSEDAAHAMRRVHRSAFALSGSARYDAMTRHGSTAVPQPANGTVIQLR